MILKDYMNTVQKKVSMLGELQNLRDKIFKYNGAKFSMKDINPKRDNKIYSNLSRLVKNNELVRLEESEKMFIATNLLKVRPEVAIKKSVDLPGWREVNPNLFQEPAKGQIYSVL